MAEPSTNYVPKTADAKMFQDVANDKTIASAVKGTHASSTLYTNFDSLRTNCVTSMIHDSYGTKGVTPTQSHHFRGYPKPTLTMSYEEPPVGSTQYLTCQPSINNKTGFNYTVTLAIDEYRTDTNGLLASHNETVTINSGGTTASSSSMTTYGGDYKVNDYNPNSTYDVDIEITHTYTCDTYPADYTAFDTFTIVYSAPTAYAHTYATISSLSCSGTYTGGTTCYSPDQTLGEGSVLYTTTAMTTTIPDGDYALDGEDDTYFNYASVESGNCNSFTECP